MERNVARRVTLMAGVVVLSACAQIQVSHYLPSGDGALRNRSLCTFGLRDELEASLPNEVKVRVWGGDPDTTSISARVQVVIPQGHNVRFTSNEFTLWTKGAAAPSPLFTTGITTACAPDAPTCQSRYGPTDWLEGGVVESSGMLKLAEPKSYRMDLAVPVAPGEPYTLKLPDLELDGRVHAGPTVRFEKTSAPAASNLQVCQP